MVLNVTNCIQEDRRTGRPLKLIPSWVTDELIDKLNIITILETGEMLKYENGRYVGHGLELVEQTLAREFSKKMDYKGNPMYSRKVKAEIMDLLKSRTYVHLTDFDVDLNILNLKNGLYNWRTNELIPHNPIYLSRIQSPIIYDETATCDKLEEVLRDIIQPKDYIKMLEFIAFIYYRHYAVQKAVILYGPEGTGKSAFLSMIDKMVGAENCSAVQFNEMDRLFTRASLCGKLLNACGELDASDVKKTAVFKNVTSGMDLLQAENKYAPPFWFVNFSKITWATNSIPKVLSDDTGGFYRRIEIIPFLHKFKPEDYDQERMDAMADPKQLSGLFNLAIKRLDALLKRRDFTNASSIDDIRELYRGASDPLKTFVESYIIQCPDGRVSCDETYELFVEHCTKYKVRPIHIIDFNNKFISMVRSMRQGTMKFGNKRVCCWEGVRIVD